ncbi:MAG: hypothetical protein K9L66_09555 [Spirochaetaceae bacterium]|nr:hypothetical protein [Spirochaetaceae bacterium]MCF7947046.1 hypothetical protein [Spirochaetia bacterium]MCF7951739.1 hypothetical protein [Spirochaetaceae bacterium]
MKNSVGKIVVISLSAGLILFMIGCATGIRDMPIASIETTLKDDNGNRVETLLPDSLYTLDFRVKDQAGEQYINPNYRDFRLDGLKNITIVQHARFRVEFRTAKATFHPPGTDLYGFSLSVKDNAFPHKIYTYPLNWDEYSKIDYSGQDGEDGKDGEDGFSASGSSADSVQGGDGEDGSDGSRGYAGKDVRLLLCRYQYTTEEKLLWYDLDRERLYLSDMKEMVIDASGGDGGRGGRGGDGGSGRTFVDESTTEYPGSAGTPGDGGDGGHAGFGGDITLITADPRLLSYIRANVEGGQGGHGGAAGKSYVDGELEKRGRAGRAGRDGRDGTVSTNIISRSTLREKLEQIGKPGFELEKVRY